MKLRSIEFFIPILLAFTMATATTFAQSDKEQKKDDQESQVSAEKFSVKLFEIRHQSPNSLREALQALGSGAKGAIMMANSQLRTLTVRDYPENIAAIEEALKRLDVPEKSPISLQFQLHLLSASMTESEKSPLAKTLEPVIAQLRATLKFTNYRYISSVLSRVSDGGEIQSSGVTGSLLPTLSGVMNNPDNPSFYQYRLRNVKLTQDASAKETIQIDNFEFRVSVPVKVAPSLQYKDVGINTPLTLREGEMAVVGTANISGSEEAIIVVVSVKKVE
jgi:type II secretory pathway component GspD/PulD (secretin)